MIFDEWIGQAYALGASDLHLEAGTPVLVRVPGELQPIGAAVSGDALLQVGQDLLGICGRAIYIPIFAGSSRVRAA